MIDSKINLDNFCDKNNQFHEFMRSPFSWGKRTYATDGHVLISVPGDEFRQRKDLFLRISELLKEYKPGMERDFIPFPNLECKTLPCKTCDSSGFADVSDCPECDGEGEHHLDTMKNHYEIDCKGCEGSGDIVDLNTKKECPRCFGTKLSYDTKENVKISGLDITLNSRYLYLITVKVEVLMILKSSRDHMIWFKGDNGVFGALMGVKV